MKRVYNFNAGPSPMPLEVLEAMKNDLTDFKGTGMGITEISHRSKEFQDMLDETKALLRELMHLDDDYEIVFIQGGGTMQFLMTAYNFLHTRAAYADTGVWAHKARNSAAFFGEAYDANSAADRNYSYIPDTYEVKPGTDYLYLCANNTIYGTEYWKFPKVNVPLICDMSSDILSRDIDFGQFDMIWAGIQKNLGAAGVALAIPPRHGTDGYTGISSVSDLRQEGLDLQYTAGLLHLLAEPHAPLDQKYGRPSCHRRKKQGQGPAHL